MAPCLEDFAGAWHVVRDIRHADGMAARFEGGAWFRHDGAGLRYHEAGELVIAGQVPVRAERRYLWRECGDGRIAVLFDDGRPFHRFDPSADHPGATHRCEADFYDVVYAFGAWPAWSARWCVTGPRKDYGITVRYRRRLG